MKTAIRDHRVRDMATQFLEEWERQNGAIGFIPEKFPTGSDQHKLIRCITALKHAVEAKREGK
jgi:hypothetical protein